MTREDLADTAFLQIRNGSEPHGLGDNSIAPAGLTSDSYAGQVFWDADTWMFPSLLALWPDYAEVREVPVRFVFMYRELTIHR